MYDGQALVRTIPSSQQRRHADTDILMCLAGSETCEYVVSILLEDDDIMPSDMGVVATQALLACGFPGISKPEYCKLPTVGQWFSGIILA